MCGWMETGRRGAQLGATQNPLSADSQDPTPLCSCLLLMGDGGLMLSPCGKLDSTRLLLLSRTCFSYFQNLLKVPAHPEAQDKDSRHLS